MSPLPRTRLISKYAVEATHVGSPYSHAVMFHHFHDSKHPAGQGSLSADQFRLMLDWISERYCILSADEYIYRLHKHSLQQTDTCLTFDDGLLCQAEVAVPILRENNIQAFFFIYSAPFVAKTPDNESLVEIYRYFRTTMFATVDDFYQEFMSLARDFFESLYTVAEKEYSPQKFLPEFPFYTDNDKWFRYLRDQALRKERYDLVMSFLMKEKNFDSQLALTKLWMSNSHLVALRDEGHVVGLHSFSHPTMLHEMSARGQEYEYKSNMVHLREILGDDPISMSHPCGRYNDDTLRILSKLGIKIGFLSNTGVVRVKSNLEVPRRDHTIVWAAMQE